ncbi:type I secretion system permease/ATPase [Desulfobacter curvatus]|uniref:type I secretion system permease/ATPase n=1 Tax=Desulfobacter curvatus TaxID=2290 RepID=UPI00037F49AE|nr:type I secretion system permease/ATPase [Desulfobacter curvatus]
MIAYLRACLRHFLFAGFFSLFINTLYLTFPLYMLSVYDKVLTSYSMPTLYATTALALVALMVLGGLDLARSRLLVRSGVLLDKLLSRRVLKEMLTDLARVDGIGYTQGLKDINTLRNYLGGSSIFAFFDVPWIFIYLWIIYMIHPKLGAVAGIGALILFIVGILQTFLTRNYMTSFDKWNNQAEQWLLKSFRSAKEIDVMGMTGNAGRHFAAISNTGLAHMEKASRFNHFFSAVTSSFGTLMQVFIYGAGAILVIQNETAPGVIIAASIIMGRALAPVNQGISAWRQTSGAKRAYDNLNRLFSIGAHRELEQIDEVNGRLNIVDLSLDIKDKRVLNGINFQLASGEIMGLMGHNGAGKSCLCRLILGMWAPTEGRVELDGRNVYNLDNDALGAKLGYLPQSVELFAGTVKENIARMGHVDDAKVVEAARSAFAHETILGFPQGYDTDIGEAGLMLSGGQRQRVGLARALYGNPGLVILDEPNSNLDQAGEDALVLALQHLKLMGTTTIMITHKPSLLNAVDKIMMLKNGNQIIFGTRQEVLEYHATMQRGN